MRSNAERLLDRAASALRQACEDIIPGDEGDASHEARMAVNSLGGALNCIAAARDHLSQPQTPFVPGSQMKRLMEAVPFTSDESANDYHGRLLAAWQQEQA